MFANFFNTQQFGYFSIGLIISDICLFIGIFGLHKSIPQQISFYNSKKELKKIQVTISFSLLLVIISGVLIFCIILFFSEIIVFRILQMPDLLIPLSMFALTIPFNLIILVLSSIFQGFQKAKEKVLFSNIINNILFFIFVIITVNLSLSFNYSIFLYLLSIIIPSLCFIIYFIVYSPVRIKKFELGDSSVQKELLKLSFPLFLMTLITHLQGNIGILMLGFFKTSTSVGLYNSAYFLSTKITLLYNSLVFIFIPLITELFTKKYYDDINALYKIMNKWLLFFTFPLILLLLFFPELILTSIFGQQYRSASIVLIILTIGAIINVIVGPADATLLGMGKNIYLMWMSILNILLIVGLNLFLIPLYALNGVAISSLISSLIINTIKILKLYSISKINPYGKKKFLSLLLTLGFSFISIFIISSLLLVNIWIIPLVFIYFLIIQFFSLFVTKNINEDDLIFLTTFEKFLGVSLKRPKKFLKKFIR